MWELNEAFAVQVMVGIQMIFRQKTVNEKEVCCRLMGMDLETNKKQPLCEAPEGFEARDRQKSAIGYYPAVDGHGKNFSTFI